MNPASFRRSGYAVVAAVLIIAFGASREASAQSLVGEWVPTESSIHEGTGAIYSKTPDDLWTATIEGDKIYLVDRQTKQKVGEPIKTTYPPQRWTFSPDGRYLVIGEGRKGREENMGCVEIWDIAAKKIIVSQLRTADGRAFGSVTHVGFGKLKIDVRYTAEQVRFDGK